jgi:hypothetical protein
MLDLFDAPLLPGLDVIVGNVLQQVQVAIYELLRTGGDSPGYY